LREKVRILLIDNYDSFTYNLVHYLVGEGADVEVVRNDELRAVQLNSFDKVVISPGPGLPEESGQLLEFLDKITGRAPILGVCLGMQALAIHAGGMLYNLEQVRHGVSVKCDFDPNSPLFKGLENPFFVGLYHSWAVKEPLLSGYNVIARSEEGVIMAMQHESLPVFAVQFHPESVLTPHGKRLISNFLKVY
jgi:anthranilate synthase/aminodeoxychorismate synthase-like glutamine amidotransferase